MLDDPAHNICQLDGNTSLNVDDLENFEGQQIPVICSNRTNTDQVKSEPRIRVLKPIKRENKRILFASAYLPSVMNLNPRSIYNKVDELQELVNQYETNVIFISETWDRYDKPLKELIQIEDYEVISSTNPRSFRGGKPALIINKSKYIVKELNPEPITVPMGVEAVWALITPKSLQSTKQIKHIALASIYYRGPKSTQKDELFDHISESYHYLKSKYGNSLEVIISGDTNRISLTPI